MNQDNLTQRLAEINQRMPQLLELGAEIQYSNMEFLLSLVEKYQKALMTIRDNTTLSSNPDRGDHQNKWTRWAKKHAEDALND